MARSWPEDQLGKLPRLPLCSWLCSSVALAARMGASGPSPALVPALYLWATGLRHTPHPQDLHPLVSLCCGSLVKREVGL